MPHKITLASGNANTGAWLPLDSSVNGRATAIFYNESQATELVFNAADATAAAAEKTAGRILKIGAGGVYFAHKVELNPATTWIRSGTASATNITCYFDW